MAVTINVPSQVRTFANLAAFPVTGAVKTIYIAEDTNKTYRWTGSVYVEISASAGGTATWGAITGTLSTQTDLQNALNAKQATLVSGTNIKTINGSSLLGAGDLSVGVFKGVHALLPLVSGDSVSAVVNGTAYGGVTTVASRLQTFPFIPNQSFTSASLSINVSTLIVGASARILIYSNLNGKPDQKLYESADLDCSTTGIKTATTSFNFIAGQTYWLTTHFNAASVIVTGHVAASLMNIKNYSANINQTSYQISVAFGSAPTTFGTPTPAQLTVAGIFITVA